MNSSATVPQFQVGLTPDEKKLYSQLFKQLDPENSGIITGDKARTTFEKSGLSPPILGEIWQLADPQNLGFLTQFGFCMAMRLIGSTQNGHSPSAQVAQNPGPLPKFADLPLASPPVIPGSMAPQSTNSSFMGTQPSALIPQNTATGQFKPSEPLTGVPVADAQKFSQLFSKTVGSSSGYLDGSQARDIFLKAKLSTPVLGQIWNLVDRQNLGKLNVSSFVIAMYLIQGLLSGQIKQLPPFLPESVWQSVGDIGQRQVSQASVATNSTTVFHGSREPSISIGSIPTTGDWVATPHQAQQFNQIFTNLDKSKAGQLQPDQVVQYLVGSKLHQQELASIWDLADIQNTGVFSRLEFAIAVFLVQKRLAGEKLPNVVPDSLITSLSNYQNQVQHTAPPLQAPPSAPAATATANVPPPAQSMPQPKSAMDDLVDIFGSPQQSRQASVDASELSDVPRVRSNLTGSFKPTSTFGQSLMTSPSPVQPQFSGAQSGAQFPTQSGTQPAASQLSAHPGQLPSQSTSPVPPQSTASPVNYDVLRGFPGGGVGAGVAGGAAVGAAAIASHSSHSAPNNDLLADSSSKELSQATTDMANYQNQIKSLATQTTALADKRARAEEELAKVQQAKRDIEGKLTKLRESYQQEVKHVEQVEAQLAKEREEKEALRSEASITEAKFNALTNEVASKQAELDTVHQESSQLKEKMAAHNADISSFTKQLEQKQGEYTQAANQANVQKSQVQVVLVKVQELRTQMEKLTNEHQELQKSVADSEQEHANLQKEHAELLQNGQSLFSEHQTLQQTHQQVKSSHAQLQQQVSELRTRHQQLQGDHEKLRLEHERYQKEAEVSQQQLAQLEKDHSHTEREISTLKEKKSGLNTSSSAAIGAVAGVAAAAGVAGVAGVASEKQPSEVSVPSSSIDYKDTDKDTDTAITSPSGSDYQYPQGNAGVIGGMVGMPGVAIGRTDSLTSSVQNNPPLSVRDDNIDDISDRETIGQPDEKVRAGRSYDSDEEKKPQSSGGESFEFVSQEDTQPEPTLDEEFPPIRELDIDESDSEDEDDARDEFDDAVDTLPKATNNEHLVTVPVGGDAVDEFDQLSAATPEAKDMFDDFDNLENADAVRGIDDDFPQNDFSFSNEFTNELDQTGAVGIASTGGATGTATGGNDEWEQLFAGFGNANLQEASHGAPAQLGGEFPDSGPIPVGVATATVQSPVAAGASPIAAAKSAQAALGPQQEAAIEELVGMGFDYQTSLDALVKQHWDLAEATNYLLDNA